MCWKVFFSFLFLFTVVGCVSVNKAIDNYKACKGDPVCLEEMSKVKESSYVITKASVSAFPIPSPVELIALGVSNLLAFGFGVVKGKRKG